MSAGIVVLGCPRSGTTLLRRLLDAHPAIACPPEPVVFGAVGRMLREDPLPDGLSFGLRSGLAFGGVPPEEVLAHTRAYAFGLMQALAERRGKPRWASKTAMDAFYVDGIEAVCGDHVRYVTVVRHGLDVGCSLRDLCDHNDGFLPELHAYVQRWPSLPEAFAHLWADVTRRLRRLRVERGGLLVRYEDLVAGPQRVMDEVFAFVGEPSVDVSLALAGRDGLGFGDPSTWSRTQVDPSRVGRSRALSAHTRSALAPIVDEELVAHGYAPERRVEPPTPAAARKAYALGLAIHTLRRGP